MRLVCEKYRWYDVSLGENIVNFFSTSSRILESTIDLKDYLIKDTLSDVEYTFENINEITNGLEIQMSNLSFQCKNEIFNGTALQDFFEVYNSTDRIKFKLYYYNDDEDLLFSGIIYKDGAEFSERVNDILDIICVTEEKEFIEYYSNEDLRMPVNPATWTNVETLFGYVGLSAQLRRQRYIELGNLIRVNFLATVLEEYPANYYIAEKPYTFAPFSAGVTFAEMGDLFHVRSGYEQFRMDGVKMYEFFSSLFQEKGWIWYFKLGKLYIKERGGLNLSSYNLDFQTDFKSHSVSCDLDVKQVDSVTVFNGGYSDNNSDLSVLHPQIYNSGGLHYYLGGDIRHVVTSLEAWTKTRPFTKLDYITAGTDRYNINFRYLDYSRYIADTDKDLIRYRVTNDSNQLQLNPTDQKSINYSRQRSLTIEPIVVSDNSSAGLDLNIARSSEPPHYGDGNYYKAGKTSTDSCLFTRSTPASAMVRYDSATGYMYTHEIDCRGQNFTDNFKKFIRSANPVLFDVEIYGVITEPFQNITISNYDYKTSVSTKTFSIQKLSFNDFTKTTKLTLQML